jgi:hypothetical protein
MGVVGGFAIIISCRRLFILLGEVVIFCVFFGLVSACSIELDSNTHIRGRANT